MAPVNSDLFPADRRPTLREERAAVTRGRILEAARRLFFRDGYAATTLKALAAEAGVAIQTVYAVFGSKAEILAELRASVISLPEADAALRAAAAEPTVERRLAGFARSIRLRWTLGGDIVKVNEDAARVDPSVRADVSATLARRRDGIAWFVRALEQDVAPGIDVGLATAVVDALTLYDLFAQLVGVHGWSADAYEAWLTDQLVTGVDRCRGTAAPSA